jgi:UDP-N-acetylmuramoylalanine-D-glutamate ligase
MDVARKQGRKRHWSFWNDSKPINFHTRKGVLSSFDKKVILIAPGKSNNEPIEKILKKMAVQIKARLLMDEMNEILHQSMGDLVKNYNVACKFFTNGGDTEKVMAPVVGHTFALAEE